MDSPKEYRIFVFVFRWAPNSKRTLTVIASVNWMMKVYNKKRNRICQYRILLLYKKSAKKDISLSIQSKGQQVIPSLLGGRLPINNKRVSVTSSSRSQLVWPLSLSSACTADINLKKCWSSSEQLALYRACLCTLYCV
jgi:hypothetical protein